jgi:hypothetical protein
MLFLQSSELGLPQPLTRRRVCPPPFGSGGGAHSLAREGVGESQFQRGDIPCGTLYMYVLCDAELKSPSLERTLSRALYFRTDIEKNCACLHTNNSNDTNQATA